MPPGMGLAEDVRANAQTLRQIADRMDKEFNPNVVQGFGPDFAKVEKFLSDYMSGSPAPVAPEAPSAPADAPTHPTPPADPAPVEAPAAPAEAPAPTVPEPPSDPGVRQSDLDELKARVSELEIGTLKLYDALRVHAETLLGIQPKVAPAA